MGYSALGGTPLPMYRSKSPLFLGQRTWRRHLLAAAAVCFVCVNLLILYSFSQLSTQEAGEEDQRLRSLRALPGAPIMSDAEALVAMYPASRLGVQGGMFPEGMPHRSEAELRKDCAQRWTLLLVEDPDEASADRHRAGRWHSTMKRGSLCRGRDGAWSVSWLDEVVLSSSINDGGRGMELSTLTWHRGRLLTCDDRTGVMYEIIHGALLPRYTLMGVYSHLVSRHTSTHTQARCCRATS